MAISTTSRGVLRRACTLLAALALFACGGGGGGGNNVTGPAAPTALSYPSPVQATVGSAISSATPTVTGSVTGYAVSPALPSGLSINAATGVISGTPTAATAQTTYTVTASNAAGSTNFSWVLMVSAAASPGISGTAATGAPITPSMNAVVTLKDSSNPAMTLTTATDANGNYAFNSTQIAALSAPFMLAVDYDVAGVHYALHSAVTAQDLTSGSATINITPLTDLVVANVGHQLASAVFANGNYTAILTPSALAAGVTALDAALQPLLSQLGVSASVDLLHQAFAANGAGLDAVLAAVQVTVDPATLNVILTNRLNNASVSGTLTALPTTPIAVGSVGNVSDLISIQAFFKALAAAIATDPTAPSLQNYFDLNNYKMNGQGLGAGGGAPGLDFADLTLGPVPGWVTTVPTGATAYDVGFTALVNGTRNSQTDFIVYKRGAGPWLILGNQRVASAGVGSWATLSSGLACTGLQLTVNDQGAVGISYAVITGPALPAAGVLLFQSGNGTELRMAAGAPSTYSGTSTPPLSGSASCGNSTIMVMSDTQIQSIGSTPAHYTVALYKDNATPTNLSDDSLVATYGMTLPAAPLTSTALNATMFASNLAASPTVLSAAPTGGTVTITWTAPTAPGLTAFELLVNISSGSGSQRVNPLLTASQTSIMVTVPRVASPTGASGGVSYMDTLFRRYSYQTPAGTF